MPMSRRGVEMVFLAQCDCEQCLHRPHVMQAGRKISIRWVSANSRMAGPGDYRLPLATSMVDTVGETREKFDLPPNDRTLREFRKD